MKGDLALVLASFATCNPALGIIEQQKFRKVKMISLSFLKKAC